MTRGFGKGGADVGNGGIEGATQGTVEGGVAAFPATLAKLFTGENFGKLVLKIAEE